MAMEIPKDLREAIDDGVAGVPVRDLATVVERLVERYRAGGAATEPILASTTDVAAYAAYRMPATFVAVRAALRQLSGLGLAPASLLDIGGGTGAALWAAADSYRTLTTATVLDQVPATLVLGRKIAEGADARVIRTATWQPSSAGAADLPRADLVTMSYVLSELSEVDQDALVRRAAAVTDQVVVVIEPGTPAGYRRVLAARTTFRELGLTVLGPCPHQGECPLAAGRDWCHFGARVSRSALHRRLKNAELSYEDEKFSFVAAQVPVPGAVVGPDPTAGRIVRRPVQRKGLVLLEVCTPDRGIQTELVSKRQGERYRAARETEWGDAWKPAPTG
jgi:ribosomal protein RSM22 (predicted rRNA methylase)